MSISVIHFFVLRIDKIWYDKMSKRRKIDIVSCPSEKNQTCTSALSMKPHRRGRGNVSEEDHIVDWTLWCFCQEQTNEKLQCSIAATSTDPQSAYRELADRIKAFHSIEMMPMPLNASALECDTDFHFSHCMQTQLSSTRAAS